jgi:hypothetical protein
LAAWDRLMGGASGSAEPLPLVCIDKERRRFSLDLGSPGAHKAVQFYDPGPDGRPTLIRVGTLYERTR